jgi:sigma-E factor negative regulatory protein RseC
VEQRVTVIAIKGNEAIVSGRRASACGDCAGKASCSTLGSWRERVVEMRVKNSIHARVGDEVLLELPDTVLLRVAFRLYGLPMLAFVLGGLFIRNLALSAGWPLPEVWAAAAGVLAVLATYSWILYSSGNSRANEIEARMVRITRQFEKIPMCKIDENTVHFH